MNNIEEIWIKAAVEHEVLNMDYFSARTKHEYTKIDIEPDFAGLSRDGKNRGLWATWCHLRNEGPRSFRVDSIKKIMPTGKKFEPSLRGRWKELIPLYEREGLKDKPFRGESK